MSVRSQYHSVLLWCRHRWPHKHLYARNWCIIFHLNAQQASKQSNCVNEKPRLVERFDLILLFCPFYWIAAKERLMLKPNPELNSTFLRCIYKLPPQMDSLYSIFSTIDVDNLLFFEYGSIMNSKHFNKSSLNKRSLGSKLYSSMKEWREGI